MPPSGWDTSLSTPSIGNQGSAFMSSVDWLPGQCMVELQQSPCWRVVQCDHGFKASSGLSFPT
jgi:hypothetical protein